MYADIMQLPGKFLVGFISSVVAVLGTSNIL
jgi:hypothetical protein